MLIEKQAVPAVCEQRDLSPTPFYSWQRQSLENGAAAFAKDASAEQRELEKKVEQLKARLTKKGSVIAEVTGEVREAGKRTCGALTGRRLPHEEVSPPASMSTISAGPTGAHAHGKSVQVRRAPLAEKQRAGVAKTINQPALPEGMTYQLGSAKSGVGPRAKPGGAARRSA